MDIVIILVSNLLRGAWIASIYISTATFMSVYMQNGIAAELLRRRVVQSDRIHSQR